MSPKIRPDIFSGLVDTDLFTRDDELLKYMKECKDAYKYHYSSDDEVIDFLNKIKNVKDAELFIEVSEYFGVARNHVDESFVKLIMIFSVIERLSIDYIPYNNWIKKTDNAERDKIIKEYIDVGDFSIEATRNLLQKVQSRYSERYGASKKVKEFLDEYLQLNDKTYIISCFRSVENEKKLLVPRCYNKSNCYFHGNCDLSNCYLKNSSDKLETELKYISGLLYSFRSKFVHQTDIPPISDSPPMSVYGVHDGKGLCVTLDIGKFEDIIEKAIVAHFEKKC